MRVSCSSGERKLQGYSEEEATSFGYWRSGSTFGQGGLWGGPAGWRGAPRSYGMVSGKAHGEEE